MKIYILEGRVNLFQDDYIMSRKQTVSNISALNPIFHFTVKEYPVIEETDKYYIRKNDDTYYHQIYSHKEYDQNYEYDYQDEIINYPHVSKDFSFEIFATMPTTNSNLEESKKTLSNFLVKQLELEALKITKLTQAISKTNEWIKE